MSYKIPFNKNTNEMHSYWPQPRYINQWYKDNFELRDNFVFEDDLIYIGYDGGRSSMSLIVKSLRDGRVYKMFWKYFDQCIRRSNNDPGPTFHGKWTFVKTGQNFSVKPYEE